MIKTYFSVLMHMVLVTAFASPVLYFGWNYGLNHFVNFTSAITWWDAIVALFTLQLVPFVMVRRVEVKYLPVPYDYFNEHEQGDEKDQPEE